ncbi:MAG TPA: M1 family metallopeptidase [Steroidobacteraceae bacterium]|nr:M1 family metallopeptidase [Steroidobacteraceae bacterium]
MLNSTRVYVAALCCALAPTAWCGAPFSFESAPGRLPKNVVPVSYDVRIVPDADALKFTGTESVQLQFRAATATVQFNSLNETLNHVLLDGKPVKSVISSDEQQLTTVTLTKPVSGLHTLSFKYSGKIETRPQGLFAQKYTQPGGGQAVLLSTQMEATDARRMFPCWDEPAFRAYFHLTVTVPASWTAVGNMPIARRTVHGQSATVSFQRSPKMPSYLVEFTAGDLREVSAARGGTRFSVWAVAGHEQDGAVALASAQDILADYNDYFAHPYPLPKLDSIAVPGGFSGAMENWGAITYNDQVLLVSPSSTMQNRQTVFSIQAHEMAHQWFGDLVTMGWWDDTWLNESFASWLAAKETAARYPMWRWWEQEDESRESAMAADARATSHAIEQHVTNELEALNSFDSDITYSKGEALLRMLEAYIGEDVFRQGIRSYIKDRAYSNAAAADLWNALGQASGKNIPAVAAPWIEKPGFPLVQVTAACDSSGNRSVTLRQKRFLLNGSGANAAEWQVPLRIRTGTAAPRNVLLDAQEQKAAAGRCDEALSVNADAVGYYRVQYDADTLAVNTRLFPGAVDGDRIALLDDQWALVGSGEASLQNFLALASSMGADRDARAWQQIVRALAIIEYAERGSPGYQTFAAYVRALIKPVADELGWDAAPQETPDVGDLRGTLLRDLSRWDDQATIDEARRRFAAFIRDPHGVSADAQATLLAIVGQNADAATFAQLHALAKGAKDDTFMQRCYTALARVRDPDLARQVVQIALSDEIPPQANNLGLRLILTLAREHPRLSWDTYIANQDQLMKSIGSDGRALVIAEQTPAAYWDALPLDQLEAWARANTLKGASDNLARGMETAHHLAAQKLALVKAADAYLASARQAAR